VNPGSVRSFLIGLAALGFGLLSAGCGGGSAAPSIASIATRTSSATGATSGTSATGTTGSPTDRLIAYSACMRSNGVPTFPDPDRQGNLLFNPGEGIDPGSPQYKRAVNACKKLSPEAGSGVGMTPAQHAKAVAALTRYVECIRKHGIPMDDPFSGPNGSVGIALPRTVDPNSPLYKHADAACKHFIPNGG
jgi:hypothetical protein